MLGVVRAAVNKQLHLLSVQSSTGTITLCVVKKYDRWNALMELLAAHGQIDIDHAATELNVSSATIRRDLDELTAQQMLVRTRGGAVAHSVSYDLPLRYKTARHA